MTDLLSLAAWLREFAADGIAILVSVVLVAGHYIHLRKQTSQNPTYSIHSVNALARRAWTESVMTNTGKDIMAVQSLRNFIMVSIMMASTASVLIIGTLTLSGQAENITRSWHSLGMFGSHSPELWIIKVLCLLLDFIVAFFAYAMSMRLATHVLFMLNVPPAVYREHPELSPESVGDRLVQAGNMIAIGMRCFLFAIPLVFWLFGPLFLALSSIVLVMTLHRLDRHEAAYSHIPQPLPDTAKPDSHELQQGSGRTLAFHRSKTA
jgi:uncharacterized membrane protein